MMKHIAKYIQRVSGLFFFILIFFLASCATIVPVPENKLLSAEIPAQQVRSFEETGPPAYAMEQEYIPFPEKELRMPVAGEKNSFDIVVTPELEAAYNAYFSGDGQTALRALGRAEKKETDRLLLWQVSILKAQTLLMMGMAADAEVELDKSAQLEKEVFGGNLNSISMRGETRVWLEDYSAAKNDFFQVLDAIGTWELPTSYGMPPSNVGQLFLSTTAQLRAYTGLAGLYLLEEDYERAFLWADAAEKRFNSVHYVTSHPLYGNFVVTHLDSYYGRALNLTFLAAALLRKGDEAASEVYFERAAGFFKSLHYTGGKVLIASLKASAYAQLGQYEKAEKIARQAVSLAIQNGILDFVWRVETVLGTILYKQEKFSEAEEAFRNAQKSVEVISGALSTDRAKTRFGAGKNDITYYLSKLDIRKKDYTALFEDLEQGRAQSFIDMLADNVIETGKSKDLVRSIRDLDQQIIRQRLMNIAPGEGKEKGIAKEKALIAQRRKKVDDLLIKNPELASTIAVWTHSLADVQKNLGPGEVMAYFLPARKNDKIAYLLIQNDSIIIKELGVTPETFRKMLTAFAASFGLQSDTDEASRGIKKVSKKGLNSVAKPSETVSLLQKVFTMMQKPSAEAMYVVPSGEMHLMPWGLLDNDWPTIVLPTGGWLNRVPISIAKTGEAGNVIVGNPDFGGELSQLPGAENEAYAVGVILKVKPIVGSYATESTVRDKVGKGVRILHLATHGIYNHDDPLNSAFYLTDKGKALPITAKQIFQHPLPAEVVVLSACETGLGKAFAGEDTLGLLRSFYLGGTVTTLSSLWPVEDEGTRVFMEIFYQYAQKGQYGEGWLAARNQLKKMGYSPLVYSSFLLGGLRTF